MKGGGGGGGGERERERERSVDGFYCLWLKTAFSTSGDKVNQFQLSHAYIDSIR